MKAVLLNINKENISGEFYPTEIFMRVAPAVNPKKAPIRVYLYYKGKIVGDFICDKSTRVVHGTKYMGRQLHVSHLDMYKKPINFESIKELYTNKGREITYPPISFYYITKKI